MWCCTNQDAASWNFLSVSIAEFRARSKTRAVIRFLWTTDSRFSTQQKIAGNLFSRLGHLRTQEKPKAPEKVTGAHLVPDGEGSSLKRTGVLQGLRKGF